MTLPSHTPDRPVPPPPGVVGLTTRERDILARISHGWTTREIAEALGISIRTVNSHRENLARKVGTSSAAKLTRYAITYRIDNVD